MNHFKKLSLTLIVGSSLLLTGCESFYGVTDSIGLTNSGIEQQKKNEEERKKQEEHRKLCRDIQNGYLDTLQYDIDQLWQHASYKKPENPKGRYLKLPAGTFICATKQDLDHLIDIISANGSVFMQPIPGQASMLAVGTSCYRYNMPYDAIGYTIEEPGKNDKHEETQVLWRIIIPNRLNARVGWVSTQLNDYIYDYGEKKEYLASRRKEYRKQHNLPDKMPQEYINTNCMNY